MRKVRNFFEVKTGGKRDYYLMSLRNADIVANQTDIALERALISTVAWCPFL